MIGIICAMALEAEKIEAEMTGVHEDVISGVTYKSGKVGDCEIVLAVCGVGKVFAALCAEVMILKYAPDAIINAGVAGSLKEDLWVFDSVLAREVLQHDMDTSAIGDPPGLISGINKIEFKTDPALSFMIEEAAKENNIGIKYVKIATGDKFVDTDEDRNAIREKFGADVCEMEGGAIAQVCYVNGVPFALLRTISDAECEDFAAFASRAADISATIILAYLRGEH